MTTRNPTCVTLSVTLPTQVLGAVTYLRFEINLGHFRLGAHTSKHLAHFGNGGTQPIDLTQQTLPNILVCVCVRARVCVCVFGVPAREREREEVRKDS